MVINELEVEYADFDIMRASALDGLVLREFEESDSEISSMQAFNLFRAVGSS